MLYEALLDGRLPAEFQRQNPDVAEFAAQVASGRLVQDYRIRDALRSIRETSKVIR